VVLPLVVGQLLRRIALAPWAAANQKRLSTLAQLGILVMVTFGSVASADRLSGAADSSDAASGVALQIGVAGLMAILIHCAALGIAIAVARRLGAVASEQIAVGIASSQKTLMVGLQIALDCGVSVLPMIIYHVAQLVIDTAVAQRWVVAHPDATAE
jgi:solute carrier family 10 (sodium/bile acid cotransporter), member 7